MLAIVQNLGLTDVQLKDMPTIIDINHRCQHPIIDVIDINHRCQHYVDGHINETVECRNFRQRVQQPGESFTDFLIALRQLVKICKFCSDACVQKRICDQIIEGLIDGDICYRRPI